MGVLQRDTKIKVPSVANLELLKVPSKVEAWYRSELGLHALPTYLNCVCFISAFQVHSTSFFFLFFFSAPLIPRGKFRSPDLGKATAATRAVLSIPNKQCMQYFHVPVLGMGTDVKMHAVAHEGCMDTVRESALKVDSGRKIPCRTGELNLHRQHAGPMLYQLSYIPIPST